MRLTNPKEISTKRFLFSYFFINCNQKGKGKVIYDPMIKERETFKTGLHAKSKRIFDTHMKLIDHELYQHLKTLKVEPHIFLMYPLISHMHPLILKLEDGFVACSSVSSTLKTPKQYGMESSPISSPSRSILITNTWIISAQP